MFVYETSLTNDPSVSAGMDEIEKQVSKLRGLNIESVVPRQLMTRDELNQVVINDFLEDYSAEDEEKDILLMSLFGLLPADFPLRDFYIEMYGEQIAGYYDAEQKAMFIISDSGFGGMERSTYAHEFVHALQDEHFDFEGKLGYTDESCAEDSERCMAIQSLLEGDATLTQQLWFQTTLQNKTCRTYKPIPPVFQALSTIQRQIQSKNPLPFLTSTVARLSSLSMPGVDLMRSIQHSRLYSLFLRSRSCTPPGILTTFQISPRCQTLYQSWVEIGKRLTTMSLGNGISI